MTLEAHYVLDEDSGSTAYDYSGNEHHGSTTGAGPAGTGTFAGPFTNSSYGFDGTDDNIQMSSLNSFATPHVTIATWAYIPSGASEQTMIRVANQTDAVLAVGYSSVTDGNLGLRTFNGASSTQYFTEVSSYPTDEWCHVAGTNDGSTNRLYVNGALVSSDPADDCLNDFGGTFTLGADSDLSGPEWFGGRMADTRFYSRALSPQEIQALYQAGVQSEVTFE